MRQRLQRFIIIFGLLLFNINFLCAQQPYDDSTPPLPADLVMKIFNLEKAYDQARDYHNNKFKKKWNSQSRVGEFSKNHPPLVAHWMTFNDILDLWVRKLKVDAGGTSASGTRIKNIETILLGKNVLRVSGWLIDTAENLTIDIYSQEMREIWEEFVKRLKKLEKTVQDLEEW